MAEVTAIAVPRPATSQTLFRKQERNYKRSFLIQSQGSQVFGTLAPSVI